MITKTKKIIIGSRKVRWLRHKLKFLKELEKKELRKNNLQRKFFTTTGDKFLNTKISEIETKDYLRKKLVTQLSSQIDVSIHSLKDLPTTLPKGLEISEAVLPRGDPADIAITKENQSFYELKNGQVVEHHR